MGGHRAIWAFGTLAGRRGYRGGPRGTGRSVEEISSKSPGFAFLLIFTSLVFTFSFPR